MPIQYIYAILFKVTDQTLRLYFDTYLASYFNTLLSHYYSLRIILQMYLNVFFCVCPRYKYICFLNCFKFFEFIIFKKIYF